MTILKGGIVPEACVLAVGKFESIHLGHRALLAEVTHHANLLGLASVVMIFDPHPYIYLNDPGYKPLFSNSEREHMLKNEGLDYLYYCRFDKNFAALRPEDFCKFLFVDCKAKLVIVGENYRFGKGRAGDTILLQNEAKRYDAMVQLLPTQNLHSDTISTSNIRNLIVEGEIEKAQQLLGSSCFTPSGE